MATPSIGQNQPAATSKLQPIAEQLPKKLQEAITAALNAAGAFVQNPSSQNLYKLGQALENLATQWGEFQPTATQQKAIGANLGSATANAAPTIPSTVTLPAAATTRVNDTVSALQALGKTPDFDTVTNAAYQVGDTADYLLNAGLKPDQELAMLNNIINGLGE